MTKLRPVTDFLARLSICRPIGDGFKDILIYGGNFSMGKKVNAELLSLDRRIIARKLLIGEIAEKDLQGLFKKLPDMSENAEEVNPDDIGK
jgi:hypothetical protein